MTDLFSWTPPPKYPDRPGFKEPTTSRAAAARITPIAQTLRDQVMSAYRDAWPDGLTADEAAARCGKHILSIRPRVAELRKIGELIPKLVQAGGKPETRPNESGTYAMVLICRQPRPA